METPVGNFFYTEYFPLGKKNPFVVLCGFVEILIQTHCSHILVYNKGSCIGIRLPDILCLFQRHVAAHRGAIWHMVFIPLPRALHEDNILRRLTVGWPENFTVSFCDKLFHFEVCHHVLVFPIPEMIQFSCIIRLPSRCKHDRTGVESLSRTITIYRHLVFTGTAFD